MKNVITLLRIGLFTVIWIISGAATAQTTEISGHYRINPIYSDGFRKPLVGNDKPGFFTMQISRLQLNYNHEGELDAELVIQDRRFWGDESAREDNATVTIYRAWIQKYFTPSLSVRLGRQDMVYDNEFFWGELNWGGTLAYDVAKVMYEKDEIKAHLALGYNANGQELQRQPYEPTNYKNMVFAWFNKSTDKYSVSLSFQNLGFDKPDTTIAYMHTFGTETTLTPSDMVELTGIYYHQLGHSTDSKRINAYFYSAQAKFKIGSKMSIKLGADVSSGTSQNNLENVNYNTKNTMSRPFGNIHGHFGYLDYFFLNEAKTFMGINDYYIKAEINPTPKIKIENQLHDFFTNQSINNMNDTAMDKNLGVENDFLITFKMKNTVKVTLAHSILIGTDTFEQYWGAGPIKGTQFFYAVITATPVFFQSKNEK